MAINVNVKELRARLKYYLDLLEQGEEIFIIRSSVVVGHLVPSAEIKALLDNEEGLKLGNPLRLADNKQVMFRRFGLYEDSTKIRELHRTALEAAGAYADNSALDRDLSSPASHYEAMGGEFWVGELDGDIVAMGGFQMYLGDPSGQAELKRMRVRPDLQGQHIGSHLLELLEGRARRKDFKALVLDLTTAPDQEPARQFYAKHGYKEMHREQADSFEVIFLRKKL